MTPQSVISDLNYVEKYHRSHGAPLTADAMCRAKAMIFKQATALGLLAVKNPGDEVMLVTVSEIEKLTNEIQRLQTLVDIQTSLLSNRDRSVA
jgi:hypothetical protein